MNAANKSILIIGKPGTSKTTFLAQFLALGRKNKSAVTFWKTPENIQPLSNALDSLRQGQAVEATQAEGNQELRLPITVNGSNLELICPDYGGEQINAILDQREIAEHWPELIQKSSSWILFVKPQAIDATYDLSNKSASEAHNDSNAAPPEFKITEQSHLIELIQFMLATKKVSMQQDISSPKLVIALTCWDEVPDTSSTPEGYLIKTMPLLYEFAQANWSADALKVMGVSAQGFPLTDENKEKYLDEGHEKFSYVTPQGSTEKVYDLTLLIAEAL